jgi:hypothetical protein
MTPSTEEVTRNGSMLHVDQAVEGREGVVGVERREDQVARQGGADGVLRRFLLSRVSPTMMMSGSWRRNRAQGAGEGQADVRDAT